MRQTYVIPDAIEESIFSLERLPNTHECEKLMKETSNHDSNDLHPQKDRKFGKQNNSSVNIQFVAKTPDIRISLKSSEVATLGVRILTALEKLTSQAAVDAPMVDTVPRNWYKVVKVI